MKMPFDDIQKILGNLRESINVEVKGWLDPKADTGMAVIVKTCLGLYNVNGGILVLGFDNSCKPKDYPFEEDVSSIYHFDAIQGLISKYSSYPFQVEVTHQKITNYPNEFPVIQVEPGVKVPVRARNDIVLNNNSIVETGKIYVRSLSANGTVSTTEIDHDRDWERLIKICSENRDSDFIYRSFLKDGVCPLALQVIDEKKSEKEIVSSKTPPVKAPKESPKETVYFQDDISIEIESAEDAPLERAKRFLHDSTERYRYVSGLSATRVPNHGSREVAFTVSGKISEYTANRGFLRMLDANNPNYTGWPPWVDTSNFSEEDCHPIYKGDAIEAYIPAVSEHQLFNTVDFWRISTEGLFYHYRALEDDIGNNPRRPETFKELDFYLQIIRTAEAIATALEFGKALSKNANNEAVTIAFRWNGLQGRMLSSWADPMRMISPGSVAIKNDLESYSIVPLNSPLDAICGKYILDIIIPLFEMFNDDPNGRPIISKTIISEICSTFLKRKGY